MKRFLKRKARPIPPNILLGLLCVTLLFVLGWLVYRQLTKPDRITDFKTCVDGGNPVLESYPEQCTYNGQSFINPTQNIPKPY
jgi:hypothetical protein